MNPIKFFILSIFIYGCIAGILLSLLVFFSIILAVKKGNKNKLKKK